ncbi:RING/U-box superfamily protein [Arabidopsis thaliana]|uniref:RING/U-box superfamily protein n=1 Tax=Arabidopsis thaliana TaxID=3702 RepID=F4JQ58_ARATH|nr:RING/U-box superfamily protein [Arabidopsis thaliana]AEE84865.1 RING/U-box superfamily protein [Arabidopsis thaliana]|eukprot:NP_001119039.1 RING/U-box superfamily protein [Arabidopsis thaliana]
MRVTCILQDEFVRWYLGLSFSARVVIYITVLGTIMTITYLVLKFLSECDMEDDTQRLPLVAEEEVTTDWTPPLINESLEVTGKGDVETASFSSSDDVDYSTLCVICFEERRNCFFVPCGHSATCRGCAQRILSEESKVCPICRRVIRKSKRLVLKKL